eukprot:2960884-Pyramimonas_sp.AAC.1
MDSSPAARLTPLGAALAGLPVGLHLGKMLVLGSLFHLAQPALAVAAGLSVQSPYVRLQAGDAIKQSARGGMESPHGDPFTLLNLFQEWLDIK